MAASSGPDGSPYDPFSPGPFAVRRHSFEAQDRARGRTFPCDVWYPAQSDATREDRDTRVSDRTLPLIIFSHYSGGNRRSSTFLCDHLAGHGYAVAALDHSEVVAPELAGRAGETAAQRAARIEAIVAARVPDIRFLLDSLLDGTAHAGFMDLQLDPARVGLVGHSFGGWTVLATPEVDPRVASVVALAPGGSSNPRPGVLRVPLTFAWSHPVPTLYLAAEDDVPIPPDRVIELFNRTPEPRRMVVLRRADHQHFVDDVEGEHEALRSMTLPGEAAWIPEAMRPIAELSSGDQAHLFVCSLTLAHLDATLRGSEDAERFLSGDVERELAARGVEGFVHRA